MQNEHVIFALRRKRAELSGLLRDLHRRVEFMSSALASVDQTLRLFDPGADPASIRPKRPYRRGPYFQHNELPRLIFGTLREAGEPLAAIAIADRIIAAKALTIARDLVAKRVWTALNAMQRRGSVSKDGERETARWSLAG